MQPGEALTTAAQIAAALAGFAGVVVAFRSKSLHEWSPREQFRLWLLFGMLGLRSTQRRFPSGTGAAGSRSF
jgi:hypothetical protein